MPMAHESLVTMFTIPNPPDYLADLAVWEAYRNLLIEQFSHAPGFSAALADADGVIRSITEERRQAPPAV
jgi:hypothetical protein